MGAEKSIRRADRRSWSLAFARIAWAISTVLAVAAGKAWTLDQNPAAQYRPPQFANAENNVQVRFLPEARGWERMDIYVPKAPPEERLPCVVFFYGGGWGGKVMWGKENTQTLLDHGYVVAVPDYVLGAQQPVPLALWDGAAAIRFLRANAAKYRVDPERLCAVGLSAGGWLVQYLAPSDSATLFAQRSKVRGEAPAYIPMVEPHPANADCSAALAAFVTDWGAGTLRSANSTADPAAWLGPNDPPMFTCAAMPESFVPEGVKAYRAAGAIAEAATVYTRQPSGEVKNEVKNPHDYGHCLVGVSVTKYLTKDKTGKEVTFGERTLQFLDEYVKHPRAACAPEILPQGGRLHAPAAVSLRTIHPNGQIHYTLDGTAPTANSPLYRQPLEVKPGVTLKALVVKPGLQPSPIATAVFSAAPCAAPVITTTQQLFRAKLKQPFATTFNATCARPVTWRLSGKVTAKALEATDPNVDNSKKQRAPPWLVLDPKTGVLSGVPTEPGVSVFIVAANFVDGQMVLCDALAVIVVAE